MIPHIVLPMSLLDVAFTVRVAADGLQTAVGSLDAGPDPSTRACLTQGPYAYALCVSGNFIVVVMDALLDAFAPVYVFDACTARFVAEFAQQSAWGSLCPAVTADGGAGVLVSYCSASCTVFEHCLPSGRRRICLETSHPVIRVAASTRHVATLLQHAVWLFDAVATAAASSEAATTTTPVRVIGLACPFFDLTLFRFTLDGTALLMAARRRSGVRRMQIASAATDMARNVYFYGEPKTDVWPIDAVENSDGSMHVLMRTCGGTTFMAEETQDGFTMGVLPLLDALHCARSETLGTVVLTASHLVFPRHSYALRHAFICALAV